MMGSLTLPVERHEAVFLRIMAAMTLITSAIALLFIPVQSQGGYFKFIVLTGLQVFFTLYCMWYTTNKSQLGDRQGGHWAFAFACFFCWCILVIGFGLAYIYGSPIRMERLIVLITFFFFLLFLDGIHIITATTLVVTLLLCSAALQDGAFGPALLMLTVYAGGTLGLYERQHPDEGALLGCVVYIALWGFYFLVL